jgi:FKBP-type peptidyl-prolyl cis-trans isomerase
VFDSSFARGKPAIMPADGLIPGWLEALPKMKVGDEWVLYIPSDLAYGSRDMGEIPPDSTLVFRLQLLGMLAVD